MRRSPSSAIVLDLSLSTISMKWTPPGGGRGQSKGAPAHQEESIAPPRAASLRRYYWLNGLDERPRVHCGAPHFQFLISGKSSPCSSM